MEFLIKAAQLILSLSIIVVLHEFGHFLPARWFRTRVEKFYLFFDPWFSVVKKKIGDTEWGIGWLPLGGYVKISGMIDESMDKEQMAQPPQPWEFRSKPAWQRLIIMVGGVTVNLILGMFIYICILWVWGREYLPLENVTWGVHASEVMKEEGVKDGDRILAIDGRTPRTLEEAGLAILIDGGRSVTLEREGERMDLQLSPDVAERVLEKNERGLFAPRLPFTIDTIVAGGNAEKAGTFLKGDRIRAVNGTPAAYFSDFIDAVSDKAGETVTITVDRNGTIMDLPVEVDAEGRVGLGPKPALKEFTIATEEYGLIQAIPAGIAYGVETLGSYVNSMKLLFSSSGAKQIGGFGTIGSLFSPTWDWHRFWQMTAFLSIILAFMNILPIPALDGGHVVFLLYEIVFRRAPNQRVLEVAQMIGIVLLLSLLLFANGNDIFKSLTGKM